MGLRRDLLLTCLIGLLLWRVDARLPDTLMGEPTALMAKKSGSAAASTESESESSASAEAPTKSGSASAEAPTKSGSASAEAPTKSGSASAEAPTKSGSAAAPGSQPTAPTTPGSTSPSAVFDVTKHGAVGDGKTDNSKAFTTAWAAACKSEGPSTLLVPKGDFLVSSVDFCGPCKVSPRVEFKGKILAPEDSSSDSKYWIQFQSLSQLHITGGGTGSVDGKGGKSAECRKTTNSNCKNLPVSLNFLSITGGSLSDITSVDSKGFHVLLGNTKDFTIHDVKIVAPQFSRNTDGVHIGNSSSITVTNVNIGTGDDCVSIGSGVSNITVTNVQCGPGHGISLGSLGKYPNEQAVKGLLVKNCTFTSTDNGVRIKTWPACPDNTVSDVRFEDITMTNVSNPIIINQQYCDQKQCDQSTPSHVKLSDIHFKNIKGTSFTKTAVSLLCSEGFPCEKVELVDIDLKTTQAEPAEAVCKNVKGVSSGTQLPKSCI